MSGFYTPPTATAPGIQRGGVYHSGDASARALTCREAVDVMVLIPPHWVSEYGLQACVCVVLS